LNESTLYKIIRINPNIRETPLSEEVSYKYTADINSDESDRTRIKNTN
jgi:hypothetical protein